MCVGVGFYRGCDLGGLEDWCHHGHHVHTCGVCVSPGNLGFESGVCMVSGVGVSAIIRCVCVCAYARMRGAVNRAVTRASVAALIHTVRRAARVNAGFLISPVLSSRVWRAIESSSAGNSTSSGGFGPPETPSFVVHDFGCPTMIRHVLAEYRNNVHITPS